jgi:hypothetical protein
LARPAVGSLIKLHELSLRPEGPAAGGHALLRTSLEGLGHLRSAGVSVSRPIGRATTDCPRGQMVRLAKQSQQGDECNSADEHDPVPHIEAQKSAFGRSSPNNILRHECLRL